MKYAIKTSFALVLLCTLLSSAVLANNGKSSFPSNKSVLTCSNSSTNVEMDDCEPQAAILEDGTAILVFSDCTIVIGRPGQDPVVLEPSLEE